MARPSRGLDRQIVVRISEALYAEADEIAELLSRADIGYRAGRADAFRVAIERGFAAIRADAKPAKKK